MSATIQKIVTIESRINDCTTKKHISRLAAALTTLIKKSNANSLRVRISKSGKYELCASNENNFHSREFDTLKAMHCYLLTKI